MEVNNRLEKILSAFESDEGRKNFVNSKAISKFDKNELYEMINSYSENLPEISARIASKMEMYDVALSMYEKSGEISEAADVAKKAGMKHKAIELYESRKDYSFYFGYAADIAEEIGMIERARDLYLQKYLDSCDFRDKKKLKSYQKILP
jgi:tetratricopeptide (TPR) repeat protein